jgi:hypothetical protein
MKLCLVSNAFKQNRIFLFSLRPPTMIDFCMKPFRITPFMALQKNFTTHDRARVQYKVLEQDSKKHTYSKKLDTRIIALGKEKKWRDIIYLYDSNKREMCIMNIAIIYNQLSKINSVIKNDPKFVQFLNESINEVESKGLQNIGGKYFSMILHALVKLQISDKRYSLRMIAELESRENVRFLFETKNVQNILMCVWSCAKLGIQSQSIPLFQMLESKADWLFENGSPQAISNSVWACATLGIQSPNLFRLLDSRADWLFENGTCQVVANSVWACATLGIQSPNLFRLLDSRADWLFENGICQVVANSVWACATLGIQSPNLFRLLDSRADWLFENGNVQNVSNAFWAMSEHGFLSDKIISLVDKQAEWLFSHHDFITVAMIARSLAKHNVQNSVFLTLLKDKIR